MRPPSLWLPLRLPDTITHPPSASLIPADDLFLGQLDILRVDDLGAIVCFLPGGEGRVRAEEGATVGMGEAGVVEQGTVWWVGPVCVSAVGWGLAFGQRVEFDS